MVRTNGIGLLQNRATRIYVLPQNGNNPGRLAAEIIYRRVHDSQECFSFASTAINRLSEGTTPLDDVIENLVSWYNGMRRPFAGGYVPTEAEATPIVATHFRY
jgi:hypothetical protein